jgi:hypothetical protein
VLARWFLREGTRKEGLARATCEKVLARVTREVLLMRNDVNKHTARERTCMHTLKTYQRGMQSVWFEAPALGDSNHIHCTLNGPELDVHVRVLWQEGLKAVPRHQKEVARACAILVCSAWNLYSWNRLLLVIPAM